jgi:hypothetical protein
MLPGVPLLRVLREALPGSPGAVFAVGFFPVLRTIPIADPTYRLSALMGRRRP